MNEPSFIRLEKRRKARTEDPTIGNQTNQEIPSLIIVAKAPRHDPNGIGMERREAILEMVVTPTLRSRQR